jgi:hypothetical protein
VKEVAGEIAEAWLPRRVSMRALELNRMRSDEGDRATRARQLRAGRNAENAAALWLQIGLSRWKRESPACEIDLVVRNAAFVEVKSRRAPAARRW